MKYFSFAVCIFLVVSASVTAERYDADILNWAKINRPSRDNWKEYNDFMHKANYSKHEWVVEKRNEKVTVRLRKETRHDAKPTFDTSMEVQNATSAASKTLKVNNGWIAAYSKGEFGSAVYWFSIDGKQKKKLSNHQVHEFLTDKGRIFAVEGLAHLGLSRGSMIEFVLRGEAWSVEEFVPLPGAGMAIDMITPGDYVVATSDAVVRVNLDKEMKILVTDWHLGALYPSSIAADDRFIYIGMRQFVGRCKLSNRIQTIELLLPNRSWLNTVTEF